ncbi:MAG: GPW/gp25 family protein [Geobacter sp.]
MTTTLTDITASDWSIKLDDPGSVVENLDDINQCLRVILETPKGSRAHEPLFGCDVWLFLDQPLTHALPGIVNAVIEAVTLWEPRVKLTSVVAARDEAGSGKLTVQIEWKLIDDDAGVQQTEVTL